MKRLFILSALIITYAAAGAQEEAKAFDLDKPVDMAAILAPTPSAAIGFSSVSEARSIINDIMDVVDIQQNFKVVSTTQVDNAAAVIYQNQRYILYNPSFINQLDDVAKDKWASISVLGHEIGHHLLGHTMDGTGNQIPKELAADEFSGLVLRRMGATLPQAQLAMRLIGSPYASATHPAEKDRLAAISKGWKNTTIVQTNRTNTNNSGVVVNSEPAPQTTHYPNTPAAAKNTYPSNNNDAVHDKKGGYANNSGSRTNGLNNQSILYDIRFNGTHMLQYFITSQNKVIMFQQGRPYVVAKIAATKKPGYPYVIYDDQQQIYIDRKGNLYTEKDGSIGYVTRHGE